MKVRDSGAPRERMRERLLAPAESSEGETLVCFWCSDGLVLINISCVRVDRLLFILGKITLVGTQSDFHVPLF